MVSIAQKLPVNVCKFASNVRYRTCASAYAFRAVTNAVSASTTSVAGDAPP